MAPPPTVAAPADLDAFLDRVEAERAGARRAPSLGAAEAVLGAALGLLFPAFCAGPGGAVRDEAARFVGLVRDLVAPVAPERAGRLAEATLRSLPALQAALAEDAAATAAGDPAASGADEVVLAYPGFYATAAYRLAHGLYRAGVPLAPRLLTEVAHRETGVDIHPGARVGRRFAVDHGTGVVVGETAVVGDGVRVFQGVTLGALTVDKALAGAKRHPTVEDGVVLYANATVLGGDTVVGAGSVVGGGVWLTRSVPPGSVVTHVAQVRTRDGRTEPLIEYHI